MDTVHFFSIALISQQLLHCSEHSLCARIISGIQVIIRRDAVGVQPGMDRNTVPVRLL